MKPASEILIDAALVIWPQTAQGRGNSLLHERAKILDEAVGFTALQAESARLRAALERVQKIACNGLNPGGNVHLSLNICKSEADASLSSAIVEMVSKQLSNTGETALQVTTNLHDCTRMEVLEDALKVARESCAWSRNNSLGSQGIMYELACKGLASIDAALSGSAPKVPDEADTLRKENERLRGACDKARQFFAARNLGETAVQMQAELSSALYRGENPTPTESETLKERVRVLENIVQTAGMRFDLIAGYGLPGESADLCYRCMKDIALDAKREIDLASLAHKAQSPASDSDKLRVGSNGGAL